MPNGYYPPPMYYPPRRETGSMFLLAGIGVIAVGAGIYLWWKGTEGNGIPPECQVEGEYACFNNNKDLYQCQNGKWVLIEKNSPECQEMEPCPTGPCYYEGYRVCSGTNLCQCQDGQYVLIQRDSPDCISGKHYKDCFVGPTDEVICLEVPGDYTDNCSIQGRSIGCHCTEEIMCDPMSYCWQGTCLETCRNRNVYWHAPPGTNPIREIELQLAEPVCVGNNLNGTIEVKDMSWWTDNAHVKIWVKTTQGYVLLDDFFKTITQVEPFVEEIPIDIRFDADIVYSVKVWAQGEWDPFPPGEVWGIDLNVELI